jgi:hypothetical protein
MERGIENDVPAAHSNGTKPHGPVEPAERTKLAPWILELMASFTLLDGAMAFDRAALARRLPLSAAK